MALVARYPLIEDIKDITGNTQTSGTFVPQQQGKVDVTSAYSSTSTITITLNDILRDCFTGDHMSISFWVREGYGDGVTSWQDIVTFVTSYGTNRIERRSATSQASDYIDIGAHLFTGDATNKVNIETDSTIPARKGEWFHYAVVRDGGKMYAYVNGVVEREFTLTGDALSDALVPTSNITLLQHQSDVHIQDVRFFSHSVSQSEVKEMALGLISHITFNSNSLEDATGYNRPITVSPTSPVFHDEFVNNYGSECAYFDTNEYVIALDKVKYPKIIAQSGPLTHHVSFMIPDDGSSLGDYRRIISSDRSDYFALGVYGGSGSASYKKINFYLAWGSGIIQGTTSYQINYGEWYTATLVTDPRDNTYAFYVNGELEFSGTDIRVTPTRTTARPMLLGNNTESEPNPVSPLEGYIDDFRMYATALSAEDVKRLSNTKASVSRSGIFSANEFIESSAHNFVPDDADYSILPARMIVENISDDFNHRYAIWEAVQLGPDGYTQYKFLNEKIPAGTDVTIQIDAILIVPGEIDPGHMQFFLFKTGASTDVSRTFYPTSEWKTFTFHVTTTSEVDRWRIDNGSSGDATQWQTVRFSKPTVILTSEYNNRVNSSGVLDTGDIEEVDTNTASMHRGKAVAYEFSEV